MSMFDIFCDTAYAEDQIAVIGIAKIRPYEILSKSFIRDGVVKQYPNTAIEVNGQFMSEKMFAVFLYNNEEIEKELVAKWEEILYQKSCAEDKRQFVESFINFSKNPLESCSWV